MSGGERQDLAAMFDELLGSIAMAAADLGAPGHTMDDAGATGNGTPARQSVPRSQMGRGKAADTIALGDAAYDVLDAAEYPMTLRQLYYALISTGAIPKTEAAYKKLSGRTKELREDGTIPWNWLVDHTRSVFEARTFDSIEGLLADSAKLYRRDYMRNQDVAIQLWAESDSIGSVISRTADQYTIPTFIGRGYSARGYLWAAAQDAVKAHEAGKRVHILHVGDHDPSGLDIFRDVEETLRVYSFAVSTGYPAATARAFFSDNVAYYTTWLHFDRLALTAEQIEEYALPVRPPKKKDTRTANFTGVGSVEVEALPVEVLLAIVEDAIVDLIDPEALRIAELAEESERAIARRIAATPVARLLEVAS